MSVEIVFPLVEPFLKLLRFDTSYAPQIEATISLLSWCWVASRDRSMKLFKHPHASPQEDVEDLRQKSLGSSLAFQVEETANADLFARLTHIRCSREMRDRLIELQRERPDVDIEELRLAFPYLRAQRGGIVVDIPKRRSIVYFLFTNAARFLLFIGFLETLLFLFMVFTPGEFLNPVPGLMFLAACYAIAAFLFWLVAPIRVARQLKRQLA